MDKTIESKLKDTVRVYKISKETSIYCEQIDRKYKMDIRVHNELRMAFDHLMRVFSSNFGIESDCVGDVSYMKTNMNKCFDHVYRVAYDSLDWTSLILISKIEKEMNGFLSDTITKIIPEYYDKIIPDIDDMNVEFTKLRAKKDIGDPGIEKVIEYSKGINKLIEYHKLIVKKKSALVKYDKKLKSEKGWELTKQFIVGLMVGIGVCLILKFITG